MILKFGRGVFGSIEKVDGVRTATRKILIRYNFSNSSRLSAALL